MQTTRRAATAAFACLSAAALLSAAACASKSTSGQRTADAADASASAEPGPPRLDLGSPENALKSYWALTDSTVALDRRRRDTTTAEYQRLRPWRAAWDQVFTGDAYAWQHRDRQTPPSSYAREIVDVQTQSPTPAVITAVLRNTTPIPPGATPDDYDVRQRQNGDTVRYVMEKDSAGWKVSQAQTRLYEGDHWRDHWDARPYVPVGTTP